MDKNPELNEAVQQQGLRLTSQRRLVMEILQASSEHLNAELVYERAHQKDPRISLATVYRTLALFKLLGLVEEHQFGENHAHFEAVKGSPHYHLTCMECGQVIEFSDPEVELRAQHLCQEKDYALAQVKLEIVGICSACQAKKAPTAAGAGMKSLSTVPAGTSVQIRHYEGGHDFAARAISMGLPLGAEVKVIQNFGHGPILIGIQGSRIALGRGEAAKIKVSFER